MKKSTVPKKLYSFGMFIIVSALAGLLVAGLAIPGAALVSAVTIGVSDSLRDLPMELETPPQAERTTFYLANNDILAQFYDENRIMVTLDQIAPVMQQALLAIEDDRFYEHGALDMKGLTNAVLSQLPGGNTSRGGSTLTQQYVKQVLIGIAQANHDAEGVKEAQAPTLERKIREMRYAIGVEQKLTKDQILEYYLNIVYFGDGAYGVESAARHYFNVSASELTLSQAAMLAGIVQTPSRNPASSSQLDASILRRQVVLDRMAELGEITKYQAKSAGAEPFDPSLIQTMSNGCQHTRYPFLCKYVELSLYQNPELGDTQQERIDSVFRGGLSVYTMIDPTSQDAAQESVSAMIAPTDPVISVIVEIQPGTGLIKAMAQNRYVWGDDQSQGQTVYNYAVESSMGGAEGYQPGSTMKPFTVAAAFEAGIPPTKVYDSPPKLDMSGRTFKTCTGTTRSAWNLQNYSPSGVMNMYQATASSVNTYFAQLEQQVGICGPVTMATAAGVKVANPSLDKAHPDIMSYDNVPTFTLGVPYVSPLSMANGYATLAASGLECDPIIVSGIKDRTGKDIPIQGANCHQAIEADIANGVNALTQGVFTIGTATGARLGDGRPIAGKSGTTDSMSAISFVGYTPEIVVLAMISKDTNPYYYDYWSNKPNGLYGLRLPSGTFLAGTGSTTVAPMLWRPAMRAAVKDLPATPFTAPSSSILYGKKASIPKTTGTDPDTDRQILEDAGFTVLDRQAYSDTFAEGDYMGANCDGYVGGTCYLTYSQGPRPSETDESGTTTQTTDDGTGHSADNPPR